MAELRQAGVIEGEGFLPRHPWVARRPITVAEYHLMGEVGIIHEDDRVELIEGELVAMAPIGSDHGGTVNALTRLLVMATGDRAIVAVQNPVRLSDRTEPQPDFALLLPRADSYRASHPRPEHVLLLIEVARSSLQYDRELKVPLYAKHGIAEVWVVDLGADKIEVYRAPTATGYGSKSIVDRGAELTIERLPGVVIDSSAVLG